MVLFVDFYSATKPHHSSNYNNKNNNNIQSPPLFPWLETKTNTTKSKWVSLRLAWSRLSLHLLFGTIPLLLASLLFGTYRND